MRTLSTFLVLTALSGWSTGLSARSRPPRQQVDGNVAAFDALDTNTIYVLGQDRTLWLEHGPFNSVPPLRQQVDGNVAAFDALDANTIYVLGRDGTLWLEHGPFGSVPPPRQQVDGNVAAFAALDANTIYVLGSNGALWLEHGPFGKVPPPRQQVDGNVAAFAALDANTIYVLSQDGTLWLEHGPFNSVPPPRQPVDRNVTAFDPVDGNNVYVFGSDGKLWLEFGPFGRVPPSRQIVDVFGLPSTQAWNGGVGFGSGPNNANSNYRLTLSSDGNVQYSGIYNDTGFLPIIQAPSQNWVAAVAVPAGVRILAFSASGNTPTASSSTWNSSSNSGQIALLWPLLVGIPPTFRVSNSSDLGSILNEIEQAVEDVGTAVIDVLEVIGAVAA